MPAAFETFFPFPMAATFHATEQIMASPLGYVFGDSRARVSCWRASMAEFLVGRSLKSPAFCLL